MMWRIKIKHSIISLLAFFCFCSSPALGMCSEAETYTISKTELAILEEHSSALMKNINELESLLTTSRLDLSEASTALAESKSEIIKLQKRLEELQTQTKTLSESLEIANADLQNARASFKAYEAEHNKVERRIRTQRNIWEALFFIACGVAAAR